VNSLKKEDSKKPQFYGSRYQQNIIIIIERYHRIVLGEARGSLLSERTGEIQDGLERKRQGKDIFFGAP